MLRGINPLLRPSARPIAKFGAPVARPALTPRLTSSKTSLSRPSAPSPRLLPAIWNAALSTKPPVQPTKIDKEHERKVAQKKIEPDPERVSSQSTVRPFIAPAEETPDSTGEGEEDVMKSVKDDINIVAETFALKSVPREVLALGLAGTLPYLATSLSTVYLSWSLNTTWPTSSNFLNGLMITPDTASHWLHLLEPIQLGYGAVIISFLGAVHWGLELGERGGRSRDGRTSFRYGLGVLAPAVAWPTLLFPVESALIGQFAAFTALYFADARAATRGWAPPWYATYRFVLTLIVGSAIFASLVGRARVGEHKELSASRVKDMTTRAGEPYAAWEKLEQEEMQKEATRKRKEEEERKRKEEEEKKKPEGEKAKADAKASEKKD